MLKTHDASQSERNRRTSVLGNFRNNNAGLTIQIQNCDNISDKLNVKTIHSMAEEPSELFNSRVADIAKDKQKNYIQEKKLFVKKFNFLKRETNSKNEFHNRLLDLNENFNDILMTEN